MSDLLPEIREICRLCDIKPARSKGQNFLVNERIYDDIVAAAEIKADDIILEVGPGLGFLTLKLAKQAERVIAVELDDKLADYLQTGIAAKDIKNIEIVNEDILRFNLGHYLKSSEEYKIVANLPYNITSIFFANLSFLASATPIINFDATKRSGRENCRYSAKNESFSFGGSILCRSKDRARGKGGQFLAGAKSG
jgi:predicted RNA methylase